jgi:RNA polymerase sigma-70 factor (ECF subfamily)
MRPSISSDDLAVADGGLTARYLELRPTLVRYFAAKLGSTAQAEDLVQELYLRVRAADGRSEVADAKAWLFRAGSNLLIDMRRRDIRAANRDHAWMDRHEPPGVEPATAEPSPERAVASRQDLARVLDLVAAMPPRMGQAFRLVRIEQLSQAEAAQRMGLSVKAVEKHLTAALRRLADARRGT